MVKLVKDILVYGGGDLLFKGMAFALLPVYTRYFSVSEYGTMALLTTLAGLIGMFSNMGLNNALQRYYLDREITEAQRPILVTSGLLTLSLVTLTIIGLAVLITLQFNAFLQYKYNINWLTLLFCLLTVLPDQLLQYVLDTIRLHFSPWKFVLVSFIKNLACILAGLVLTIGFDMGLQGYFAGVMLASLAAVPVAIFMIRHDLVMGWDTQLTKSLVLYGYPFVFAAMAYWIFGSMDRWMLAELSTTVETGLYSIAFKFSAIILFVNTAFAQAWAPTVLKMHRDDAGYRQSISKIFSAWFALLTLIGAVLSLFSRELIVLLTPKDYWEAAPVMAVVVMGLVLSGTTQITALGIAFEKQTRLLAVGAWLAAVVNFALNLFLIPRLGALGAAWTTLFAYGVLSGFYFFCSQRLHPLPVERGNILICFVTIVAVLVATPIIESITSIPAILLKLLSILVVVVALYRIVSKQLHQFIVAIRTRSLGPI